MKINWKVRLQHKSFWVALTGLIILLAQQLGFELPGNIDAIINTILSIAVLIGVINDPTTHGLNDSNQAMLYEEPK
ncbi:phage holin [Vaginisenegalia massiliensis]|uniref:phage holin n=1 Tax=Vaginisenegalia massiliensis TaxID=2058294 RepID=UPI000F530183|nr:phage holin [Vaginisenegalia massiliensis]